MADNAGSDAAARAAAAAAAQLRSAPKAGLATGAQAKKARDEQKAFALKLLKLIDESTSHRPSWVLIGCAEIIDALGPVKRQQALDVIDLLIQILDNALRDPEKRSVNMKSKKVVAICGYELLDPTSGAVVLYLHEAGFVHGVTDFTPRRIFPARPTSFAIDRCSIALDTVRARCSRSANDAKLKSRRDSSTESHAWTERTKTREAELEAARIEKAKLAITDDREGVSMRVERERIARAARAAAGPSSPRKDEPPAYEAPHA